MNSRQRPKHGYSLDRESYIHRVQQFMRDAFYYFVEKRISRSQCLTEVDHMSANELRRLLDLQLPQWVLIAPADARFSRSLAVEQSIAEVDHRAGSIWPVTLSSRAQRPAGHKVTITLSDRKQFQEMFFYWVRRRCADALSGPQPEVFPAPAADTFLIWDHLLKGLTYHFQAEIARANGYLRHLVWFEHRAGTCLDGGLRIAKFDLTTTRTRRDLVPVERIWQFAVREIALQMGRASGELVLPNRETGEGAFFSRIEGSRVYNINCYSEVMTGQDIKAARMASSWTQNDAAEKLGVTQAYLSMVERGTRAVSAELASKAVRILKLSVTALPLAPYRPHDRNGAFFQQALGSLGYPGFAYVRRTVRINPTELLMAALDSEDLDARVTEALPWLAVAFPKMDWAWLTFNAKVQDRQNRLAFITLLAAQIARRKDEPALEDLLLKMLETLERSRLAAEDTLCNQAMTAAERKWLRTHRSSEAEYWNLLTDLRVENLDHALL